MKGPCPKCEVLDHNHLSCNDEKDELVCFAPFPAMPIDFWNDPDGSKCKEAYFEHFPRMWCQGDYAEITIHLGFVIQGRYDTTLNSSGVRIGSVEIYRQLE